MISARTPSLATLSSFLLIVASGCVIDGFGLEDRRCPCVSGWVCDEAADRCVEVLTADAGEVLPDADVSEDAYVPVDAPPLPYCETITNAIFCEDFESGDLTRWGPVEPAAGGSITASGDAAHSGRFGLHLSAPAGSSITRLATGLHTEDDNVLFFRAWVRVSTQTAGTLSVFELFAGSEGSVSAQMLPGSRAFRVRIDRTGTAGESDDGRGMRWTVGAWNCVRGHVVRDSNGVVEMFEAGSEEARLSGHDTDWGTPYDTFKIAVAGSTAGSQIDLDDIVWARSDLLCP
jgi:hypothetical protein